MTSFSFRPDRHRPRNVLSLNGFWELQPGTDRARPEHFRAIVPVPGLVDLADPAYEWNTVQFHWYRCELNLTTEEIPAPAFLQITQAQFGTAVWLNGKEIGSSISCYTSQEYRLDPLLKTDKNELLIRVGAKETLPPESAVGKDQERERFIPGIWGDVSLVVCGNPRIKHVQIIPHIDRALAEVRVSIENTVAALKRLTVSLAVFEKGSGRPASVRVLQSVEAPGLQVATFTIFVRVENVHLWSPDSPFLYELETSLSDDSVETDRVRTIFGMRTFEIRGKGFYLNGERIFLKGGNIAFHRFLADPERKLLPWTRDWIKRVLIDIPKEHNFNFFRNHLGQMYPLWYDLADEYGMLIQNEWHFWGTTGTKEQITREFTEWIRDNCNHPSIIIWDPLNESTDDILQQEIIPAVRPLDPTRPWESVDFTEEHPYIYSLGPVLNDREFGFSRALSDIEKSTTSAVLNEFIWWWMNSKGEPTSLMKGIVERWLGPTFTKDQLLEHQAFLAGELVELFRRMRVDAIQPFVYLSNNDGPTAHWFLGPIADLQPKPILAALKNAYAPFGLSLELWDRHFFAGESRIIRLFVFNDLGEEQSGTILYGVRNMQGGWLSQQTLAVNVPARGMQILPLTLEFPAEPETYHLRAELRKIQGAILAWSQKIAHVFSKPSFSFSINNTTAIVLDPTGEIQNFLSSHGIATRLFPSSHETGVIIVGAGQCRSSAYTDRIELITQFVNAGGVLVVIEPEFSILEREEVKLLESLTLSIEHREDRDSGGYDSYVFATDPEHPLWSGLASDHLKMFNGGYGGEVVSQHNVTADRESTVHARCGRGLSIPAVFEIPYGLGTVLVSRLQIRNRLCLEEQPSSLYGRRPDPVLQRYVLNLLAWAAGRVRMKASAGEIIPDQVR